VVSRLVATRGDVAACWANTARLQAARGDHAAAEQSKRTAAQVSGVNGWLRAQVEAGRFRLWRYRVWCKRVADRQDEFRNAWTGLDMNDAAEAARAKRRVTKALAKQVKWKRRLKK
jgi:hypothetical protein